MFFFAKAQHILSQSTRSIIPGPFIVFQLPTVHISISLNIVKYGLFFVVVNICHFLPSVRD